MNNNLIGFENRGRLPTQKDADELYFDVAGLWWVYYDTKEVFHISKSGAMTIPFAALTLEERKNLGIKEEDER